MRKRIAALLLVTVLLAALGTAWAEQRTAAEYYETGLIELQRHLAAELNMPDEFALEMLAGDFQGASGYAQADGFLLYVRVLDEILKMDFDQAEKDLALLKEDQGLNALLAEEDFSRDYPAVKPVDILEKCLEGRRAEAEGEIDAAIAAYRACGDFYYGMQWLGALERRQQEEAPAYARGYVLVTYATGSGWLPLPEEESYVYPLMQMRVDGTITVNNICVTPEGVYMESSTCENQDCVHEGLVTLENRDERVLGNMIICLPNQVYLELYSIEELLGTE